jgi:hypothetical protein
MRFCSVLVAKSSGRALLVAALCVVASCSKTPEPTGSSAAATPPATAKAQAPSGAAPVVAAPKGPSEIAWNAPASWQKVDNPNPMRKATYRISRASGDAEDAELSVSQAGGTVALNIQRWAGQFEQKSPDAVKRTERTVAGLKVTLVEVQGTLTGSGMPGAPPAPPKPSYALLGAIVETEGTFTFFKLTGPEKTLTLARADFDKLIDSISPK